MIEDVSLTRPLKLYYFEKDGLLRLMT